MPPTRAARWMTTSAPSIAARAARWSRRSWSAERITRTSAPSVSSSRTVGRPRKPPPPVTATAFPRQNSGSDRAELTALTLALVSERVSIEVIEHDGTRYAEIIWADVQVEKTTFFSPPESSFQFGLLAHEAGYQEEPHYHKATSREVSDLQQMFVMQRGVLDVQVFDDD